jgi:hypothetical protein
MKAKKPKSMDEVSKGYESFIKGKELKDNSKSEFDKAIKKATKPKQRGSK